MRQIAEKANVSRMTVSRVLGGGDGPVSPEVRERVLMVARELDYIPVRPVLQNRRVATQTIGVLLDGAFVFDSLVGARTFEGLRQRAFELKYDLLLLHSEQGQDLEEHKAQFLDRRCDGFIFVVPFEREEVFEMLRKYEVPAVACYTRDVPESVGWAIPDNRHCVQQGLTYLRNKGHEKIAFWASDLSHSDARERLEAYQDFMSDSNLPALFWSEDHAADRATRAAGKTVFAIDEAIVDSGATAVMCHNDERAITVLNSAKARGLFVPDDLSVIGIDDTFESAAYGVTTFRNPMKEIGWTAIDSIANLCLGGEISQARKRLPMKFVERCSVSAPRK